MRPVYSSPLVNSNDVRSEPNLHAEFWSKLQIIIPLSLPHPWARSCGLSIVACLCLCRVKSHLQFTVAVFVHHWCRNPLNFL